MERNRLDPQLKALLFDTYKEPSRRSLGLSTRHLGVIRPAGGEWNVSIFAWCVLKDAFF